MTASSVGGTENQIFAYHPFSRNKTFKIKNVFAITFCYQITMLCKRCQQKLCQLLPYLAKKEAPTIRQPSF